MAPIELSFSQTFELERLKRSIESETDPLTLQTLAKDLLKSWWTEKAHTDQMIRDQLTQVEVSPKGSCPRVLH